MTRYRVAKKLLPLILGVFLSTDLLAAQHALLIGISDYQAAGLAELPGTLNDVKMVADTLKSRLGFQPQEITILENGQATHTGIRRAFADLAEAVAPGDFVYIHYSGHGSLVTDLSGDGERTGQDQTLVSYGARTDSAQGDDRYDILDDELNAWLAPIAAKAGEMVYVADSCHSATNTRGDPSVTGLVARAAPPDSQKDHPYAHLTGPRNPLTGAVLIGAARDDQSAHEMVLDDGEHAGAFSYNWARSLRETAPGDTWRRVFDRAAIWSLVDQRVGQQPQISGAAAERQIRGGRIPARPAVGVTDVRGSRVTLNAGRLSGLTVGSVYAHGDSADAARVRITETSLSWSAGELQSGTLETGDFLIEREHAYVTEPVQVFALAADDPRDQPLADRIRERVAKLSGFLLTDSRAEADLVLAFLRPLRKAGALQYSKTDGIRDSLPLQDPAVAPEVWVLDGGEHLIHDNMAIGLAQEALGLETLTRNLDRYRRVVDLKRLAAESQAVAALDLALVRYAPCRPGSGGCLEVPDTELGVTRLPGTSPLSDLRPDGGLPENTVVSFTIANRGLRDRYVYLFELAPDASVKAIFPEDGMPPDAARIRAGETLDLSNPSVGIGLILDRPGDASLLVLGTRSAIDTRPLTQPSYQRLRVAAGSRGEGRNPLERLLDSAAAGSSSRGSFSFATGAWDSAVIDYRVNPVPTTEP